MAISIDDEIKSVERETARLARRKDELMQQRQAEFLREKKLDIVLAESGYGSPLDLVEAFIRKFGLKVTGENSFLRKRKRVKVTSDLRDAIRKECADGLSMNRASKKYDISYAVVSKILNGTYDGLM